MTPRKEFETMQITPEKPYVNRRLTSQVDEYREEVFLLRMAGWDRDDVRSRVDFEGPDHELDEILDALYQDAI